MKNTRKSPSLLAQVIFMRNLQFANTKNIILGLNKAKLCFFTCYLRFSPVFWSANNEWCLPVFQNGSLLPHLPGSNRASSNLRTPGMILHPHFPNIFWKCVLFTFLLASNKHLIDKKSLNWWCVKLSIEMWLSIQLFEQKLIRFFSTHHEVLQHSFPTIWEKVDFVYALNGVGFYPLASITSLL